MSELTYVFRRIKDASSNDANLDLKSTDTGPIDADSRTACRLSKDAAS